MNITLILPDGNIVIRLSINNAELCFNQITFGEGCESGSVWPGRNLRTADSVSNVDKL